MPPAISTLFPDALDARISKHFNDRFKQIPDMIAQFYAFVGPGDSAQKQDYRTSSTGTFGDVPEFSGTVTYDDVYEGYDGTITPRQYATGFQIERRLFDDDLTGVMDKKPREMATAFARTRQRHAAQLFNNGFSIDTTWNDFTENVALFSNSHTTRASGVSTASGFDNLVTGALNVTNVNAARIQMRAFRGDRAERISVMPDLLVVPPDLEPSAFEIVQSAGLPDSANNNANFLQGRLRVVVWDYLTDTNNWFLADSTYMKDALTWFERVAYEFAMVEDFDTLIGKWRLYARYGHGHNEWRWGLGAQVS